MESEDAVESVGNLHYASFTFLPYFFYSLSFRSLSLFDSPMIIISSKLWPYQKEQNGIRSIWS